MPRVSIIGIRCALGWLAAGSIVGLLAAMQSTGSAILAVPLHIHWHWMFFGWMTQFALSVAWWILPRFPGGSRGSATRPWTALLLLNLGQLVAGPAQGAAAILELCGLLLYLTALMPRVGLLSPRERAALEQH